MQLASAEAAGDFDSDVLLGKPQLLLTVRALGKDIGLADVGTGGVEAEVGVAELALDSLTQVLAVDFQFLSTFRAAHEQARGDDFDHRVKLLQWDEDGNFDAVPFEFRIEQCSTIAAVNHARRHLFAALWTGTTGPGRHLIASQKMTGRKCPANDSQRRCTKRSEWI